MAEEWTLVVAVAKLPKGWVSPFYEIDNIGSAHSGPEAKRLAEERLTAQEGS
jgi:hypothetical protein